jgi:hypothetical protein
MVKLRPGIEYPIIPEDLIASEAESLQLKQGQVYPRRVQSEAPAPPCESSFYKKRE